MNPFVFFSTVVRSFVNTSNQVSNQTLTNAKSLQGLTEKALEKTWPFSMMWPWSGVLPSFAMMTSSAKSDLRFPAKKTAEMPEFATVTKASTTKVEVKVNKRNKTKRK